MAAKKAHTHEVDVVDKVRGFWAVYSKPVTYIGSAIIIFFIGWMIYKYMFKVPKQEKADKVVFVTQKYFNEFAGATDSAKILLATKVLNGDGTNPGALRIINQYSGTPAANLCEY
ncbi:MAG TPA: hypothetical protein VFF57_09130, partial [Hanamia sp.]|nr:hypothetical protein [Hanamia sp.]